jgi:Ca2+-transporting ATPase
VVFLKSNVVSILKNGQIVNIAETELFKDDILLLQTGDLVSADAKLIETRDLEVDEFDLTGEIIPVSKELGKEDVYVYKGSKVTRGTGKGLVVATGEETEYGKILQQRWRKVKIKPPSLIKRKYFALLALLLLPLIASAYYYGNLTLITLTFSVMAVFVVLLQNSGLFKYLLVSNEIKKLKNKNVEFQDETAFEDISRASVVCFDKTGVLTTRDIEVKQVHFADESPDMKAFASDEGILGLTKTACALCNDVIFLEKINQADPIDRALISFATKNGVDVAELASKYERTYQKPFDSEDRYMASGFAIKGKKIYFVKGEPEVIINACDNYVTANGTEKKIDLDFLSTIKSQSTIVDVAGDRTIALAYAYSTLDTPPSRYIFLCLVQFENPLKPAAKEAVKVLKDNGIRPIIVTGDRPETALKIGKEVGIDDKSDYSLTGRTMERMDFTEIARQTDYISVYSRVLPSQKGILVRLLQQRNKFVAMVGDGANDTVALKVADVGISFFEDSSPFAKRVAKILINDLSDLRTLIQSAKRVNFRLKLIRFFRITFLVSLFLVLYTQLLLILQAIYL